MQRAVALSAIVFVFAACDPWRNISVSQPIAKSLDRTCIVEALRMEKPVRKADVGSQGQIYTELIVPANLKGPQIFTIGVEERRDDKGQLEINLYRNWVGSRLDPDYGAYLQKLMEDLRDRVIEKCGGR